MDTNGVIAQLTINAPSIAYFGTSSHPPAKSTRTGTESGALICFIIEVVEIVSKLGSVFGRTTYSAPIDSHRAFFISANSSSSVTARISGLQLRNALLKSRPSSSSLPIYTSSISSIDCNISCLCRSGKLLDRPLWLSKTFEDAKLTDK